MFQLTAPRMLMIVYTNPMFNQPLGTWNYSGEIYIYICTQFLLKYSKPSKERKLYINIKVMKMHIKCTKNYLHMY